MSNRKTDAAPEANNVVTSDTAANIDLTAYQGGAAVIRETRTITLPEGRSRVFIAGLPKTFVQNSQTIVGVNGEGSFRMGQRSLRPANLTHAALLAKSKGSKITLIEQTANGKERRITGVLEHIVDNRHAILKVRGERVLVVPITPKFELPGIPAGLSDLTVLALEPTVEKAGQFSLRLLYEAEGINWTPWYEIFYNRKEGKLERFACFVDLPNNTGADFADARIKLMPGINQGDAATRRAKRHMAPQAFGARAALAGGGPEMAMTESVADFSVDAAEVEDIGDGKMYKLVERVNLENGVPNSPALVFFGDVPVEHEYHAYAGHFFRLDGDNPADLEKQPVHIVLRLTNNGDNNLGAALPPGDARIYEPDSQGELQKTDSASVENHVSVGEEFALKLRNPARDIKVTRELIDYKEDPKPAEKGEKEVVEEGGEGHLPIRTPGGPGVGMAPQFGMSLAAEATTGDEAAADEAPAGEAQGRKRSRKAKPKPRYAEEERETVVYNFKDEDVEVIIHENIREDAKLIKKSHDFIGFTGGSGTFTVTVPAKSKEAAATPGSFKFQYRIRYRIAN